MFDHEVSQAQPVQAREAEEVPRSQLGGIRRRLRRRGDLTVWFDEEAIANWKADKTGKPGGQRVYSGMAIETSLVVRMVYKLAYRQTEGFLHSMASLFGLGVEFPGLLDVVSALEAAPQEAADSESCKQSTHLPDDR